MKKKMLISLFILLAIAVKSFSQDMLIKTNRDTLFVKIIEVGDKEIKYKLLLTLNTSGTRPQRFPFITL